eukprot:5274362-Pyramimonas_sp.AAC.1
MSTIPFARSWEVIGRAIRAVLEISGAGREILNISDVGKVLRADLQALAAPAPDGCRLRCGCQMHGRLQVSTFDVDQAFVSCRSENVMPAWLWLESRFRVVAGVSAI